MQSNEYAWDMFCQQARLIREQAKGIVIARDFWRRETVWQEALVFLINEGYRFTPFHNRFLIKLSNGAELIFRYVKHQDDINLLRGSSFTFSAVVDHFDDAELENEMRQELRRRLRHEGGDIVQYDLAPLTF